MRIAGSKQIDTRQQYLLALASCEKVNAVLCPSSIPWGGLNYDKKKANQIIDVEQNAKEKRQIMSNIFVYRRF